jgi:predicted RNase H-like nuclease (RuvC/YqgF family)
LNRPRQIWPFLPLPQIISNSYDNTLKLMQHLVVALHNHAKNASTSHDNLLPFLQKLRSHTNANAEDLGSAAASFRGTEWEHARALEKVAKLMDENEKLQKNLMRTKGTVDELQEAMARDRISADELEQSDVGNTDLVAAQHDLLFHRGKALTTALEGMEKFLSSDVRITLDDLRNTVAMTEGEVDLILVDAENMVRAAQIDEVVMEVSNMAVKEEQGGILSHSRSNCCV